jgi:heat shock protein HslJ
MRASILLIASLLASPASAAPKAETYKAGGTEPFWSLAISPRTITFEHMDLPKVTQATRKPRQTKFGRVYWTRRISVAIIANQPCSDGMSDFVYRDDVTVTVDGKKYRGCGGPRHLPRGAGRP